MNSKKVDENVCVNIHSSLTAEPRGLVANIVDGYIHDPVVRENQAVYIAGKAIPYTAENQNKVTATFLPDDIYHPTHWVWEVSAPLPERSDCGGYEVVRVNASTGAVEHTGKEEWCN